MNKLAFFAPMGRNIKQDLTWYLSGLGLMWVCSLGYVVRLLDALDDITRQRTTAMPSFVDLLSHALVGFPLLAVLSMAFAILYYQMHYGSSRSVYLMRRLPDPWAFHRRCLGLPLLTAMVTMVVAACLLGLYYALYCHVTPAGYFQEGQWQLLWEVWMHRAPSVPGPEATTSLLWTWM